MAAIPAAIGSLTALEGLTLATGLGSAALSAASQNRKIEAQEEAAEFNASVQEQKAEQERDRAAAEASDFRRKQGARRASAIADRGASGVRFAGTPLLTDTDVIEEIELGAARIGQGGEMRATAAENTARLDRARASSLSSSRGARVGASLLGGTARAFGSV